MKRIKKISEEKRTQATRTIHSLQRKIKAVSICPHCGRGISMVASDHCLHCSGELIWYMDVVGKPGEEELCREEYKAKMIVNHPELAKKQFMDGRVGWIAASAAGVAALLAIWILAM